MRTVCTSLAALLLVIGCGGSSTTVQHASSSDGPYEIHLVRRPAVGTSFGMVARHTSSSTTETSIGGSGPETETEARTTTLDARYTVLALGPTGLPSQLRVEVHRFTVESPDGVASPSLPPVLLMTEDATTGAAGEPISEDVLALLSDMPSVASTSENSPDDDVVFGIATPQTVGASWPIDAGLMASGLSGAGMVAAPEAVTGQTQLVRTTTEAGLPCVVVHSLTRIGPFTMPDLPDGAQMQSAQSSFEGDLTLPLDATLPALHDHSRMTIDVQLTFPTDVGQASMRVHSTDEDARDVTLE